MSYYLCSLYLCSLYLCSLYLCSLYLYSLYLSFSVAMFYLVCSLYTSVSLFVCIYFLSLSFFSLSFLSLYPFLYFFHSLSFISLFSVSLSILLKKVDRLVTKNPLFFAEGSSIPRNSDSSSPICVRSSKRSNCSRVVTFETVFLSDTFDVWPRCASSWAI